MKIDLGRVYADIWKDAAPVHLVVIAVFYDRALAPLCHFGPPVADVIQPMPYSAAQTMADFLWPPGSLNYWKSGFLKALSDEAIDTILGYCAKAPSPHRGRDRAQRPWRDEPCRGCRDGVRASQLAL